MIHVSTNGDRLFVEAPARLAPLIAKMPGFKAERGTDRWHGALTWTNMLALAKDLSGLEGWAPDEDVTAAMIDMKINAEYIEQVKSGEADISRYDDRLFSYQPAGVYMLLEGSCTLGDDMGTGKTVMALTAARQVGGNVLIVAPNSMKFKWVAEAETWFPEARAVAIDGTPKQKAEQFTTLREAEIDGAPIVCVVNWESLRTLTRIAGYGSIKLTDKDRELGPLNEFDWTIVVADEVHRAKDPKGKQNRALRWVSQDAKYRWGLTGTPVLNTPRDLWAIGRFIDPESYGNSLWDWHARFIESIDTFHGIKDIGLNPLREKEFLKAYDVQFIRRIKREVLDLPPVTGGLNDLNVREVPMQAKQKAAYNRMVKDLIVGLDSGVLLATDPLALLTRLTQLASATPVIDSVGDVVALDKPSNKVSALLDFVDDELPEDESLVVFAASRKLLELAGAELTRKGHSVMYITGTVEPEQRHRNIESFQAGEVRIALCTMGAGAEGITLTRASTCIFLQRSYAYGQSVQAEARVDRIGQENPVTIIDLVTPGTVDEEVIEALASKGEMAEQVLRDSARKILETKV